MARRPHYWHNLGANIVITWYNIITPPRLFLSVLVPLCHYSSSKFPSFSPPPPGPHLRSWRPRHCGPLGIGWPLPAAGGSQKGQGGLKDPGAYPGWLINFEMMCLWEVGIAEAWPWFRRSRNARRFFTPPCPTLVTFSTTTTLFMSISPTSRYARVSWPWMGAWWHSIWAAAEGAGLGLFCCFQFQKCTSFYFFFFFF